MATSNKEEKGPLAGMEKDIHLSLGHDFSTQLDEVLAIFAHVIEI